MGDRVDNVFASVRRKLWPYTDVILAIVTLGFILLSWALTLFGVNTLQVITIVAAIGFSSTGLANTLAGGISVVRADVRDRLPAKVCNYRPDMAEAISRATQLIQIVSYDELISADRSRRGLYNALRAATRKTPHQRIIWNTNHILWIKQDLQYWNNADASELYGYLPRPGTSMTTFILIDESSIIFGQNWETGKHIHLDGADIARHFRFYFEGIRANSICIKRRGNPIDVNILDAFEASLNRELTSGRQQARQGQGRD